MTRLSFASREEINAVTGYEFGSVAPFSLRDPIPLVLDEGISERQRVNISAGDPRLGLELERFELVRLLGERAVSGRIAKQA